MTVSSYLKWRVSRLEYALTGRHHRNGAVLIVLAVAVAAWLACHSRALGRLMNRKYRAGAVKNPLTHRRPGGNGLKSVRCNAWRHLMQTIAEFTYLTDVRRV
jgi:hypothetical protein